MDSDTPSTARGLLMLMLRPIPTFFMEDLDTTDMLDLDTTDMLDLDTSDTMAMDSDTESMARGLLMLRLSLILTTSASRLYQDLSVNHRLNLGQKWIVISLKFPSPVLQFQCYHTKSLVMVSRQQENHIGKNPTNKKITKKK